MTGAITAPSTTAADYSTWEAEKSIIMAWLINSMEPSIGRTYLFYQTAMEDLGYSPRNLFPLKINLNASRFGQKLATPNKENLTELWQETDLFYEIGWAGPTDAEK